MAKFRDFNTVMGEAKAEWVGTSSASAQKLYIYSNVVDSSKLRVLVTDFKFNTWSVTRSALQLEHLRSTIGVVGPWSDFVEFIESSLRCENVKIIFEGQSEGKGPAYATLTAQKSRDFPLLTLPLDKLVGVVATEATGDFAQELFKGYKSNREMLAREQTGRYQLTETVAAEQEKSKILQRELELLRGSKKHKAHHMNETATLESMSVAALQESSAVDKEAGSAKGTNRVVPAYRRAKVRGILMQDTDEDAYNSHL